MTFSVINICKKKITRQNIINDIINGLTANEYDTKVIPSIILYDDRGLQLFDQITYTDEYYLTNCEINILNKKVDQITDYIASNSSVIELGAGSLRKTRIILNNLEKKKKNITFYALDLMENELNKSLSSLGTFSHVKLVGLCGTYEDGIDYVATLSNDKQKTIMWLGSSIGNLSREDGANFIRRFQEKAMNPGDLFLIGIDGRNDPEKIAVAYNDPQGITAEFAMNGLDHLNVIFDQPFINRNNFYYISTYDEDDGRREGYYKSKKDQILEFVVSNDINKEKIKINVKENELIRIAYSFKYNKADATKLFYDARLAHVESWSDSDLQYNLHLIYKPPFFFTRPQELKGSAPTVEEWQEIWKSWDTVSLSMIPLDKMHLKPIYLRHPFIFYLGHIPSFLDTKLATYSHEKFSEPENFANIFEREIDHDMDDLSKCNPHSAVPDQWPKLSSILEYQDKVRQRLLRIYDAYKDKQIPRSLGHVLWMSFEHEAMHIETFLYNLVQFEDFLPAKGIAIPNMRPPIRKASDAKLLTIPTQTITFGLYDDGFDWDSERTITVKSFKIQSRPITNNEYLEFMKATMNQNYPLSWIPIDLSSSEYRVRTVFGPVDMSVAMNWPVLLSLEQANHYAGWAKMRLPTEEELLCFYNTYSRNTNLDSNFGFSHWHPTDVPLESNSIHNIDGAWAWTSSKFGEYPEFVKSKLYSRCSSDFFDGKHYVILGGSW
ncbi:27888_t:CDS:2 [Dentiscutata erythropus]|uniref:27888_t:CDS:1 n=1 Tax=Dentiscutata erythropus TaxID=1348616 RepID=A0A9N8WRB4_9GLOM|nr:27888_t:CDS:2 [Dentiscutata erythropus]